MDATEWPAPCRPYREFPGGLYIAARKMIVIAVALRDTPDETWITGDLDGICARWPDKPSAVKAWREPWPFPALAR